MADSLTLTTQSYQGRYLELECSQRIDIENNRSIIDWTLYSKGGSSSYYSTGPTTVTINGTRVYYKEFTSWSDKEFPAATGSVSGSLYVEHNSDGTKVISVSLSTAIYTSSVSQYSDSWTLDDIARASAPTLSKSEVEFGENITIYSNRASGSFTHDLYYIFNGGDEERITSFGDSYTWTIPKDLMNRIRGSTAGYITFRVYTISGGSSIGSNTVSISVDVPANVVPVISSISCTDATGNLSKFGGYVQNKSRLKISVNAAGAYSSEIKTYKISAGDDEYSSNNVTTGELTTAGAVSVSATVTDSRGRTASKTTSITVLAYTGPTIDKLRVYRCNADGAANESGSYMKVELSAKITALNNKNGKTFRLEYKKSSVTSWTTKTTYTGAYTWATSYIISADPDSSYDIRLTATDSFSSATYETAIGTEFTLMDLRYTGKGIAFGKVSESDNFDVNMEAQFRKAVRAKSVTTEAGIDLDRLYNNVTGRGSNSNGNYYKFTDGTLICTKSVNLGKPSFNTAWGVLYETPLISLGSFAVPFVGELPKVSCTMLGSALIECVTGTTLTQAGSVWLVRPDQYSNNSYTLNLIAIGRWK